MTSFLAYLNDRINISGCLIVSASFRTSFVSQGGDLLNSDLLGTVIWFSKINEDTLE